MISSLGDEIWRTALALVSLITHEKSQTNEVRAPAEAIFVANSAISERFH